LIVAQEKKGNCGFFDESFRPKKPRRHKAVFKKEKLALTGLVLAGFLVGVLITYYCSQLFTLGYQINRLNKELAALRVENHSLDEEIQRLVSLDNIESLAIHKLKMVKPDTNNVLVVTVAATSPRELTPPSDIHTGQPVAIIQGEKEKSRLIKAFAELVNRFESKNWLGSGQGYGFWEGANANNKHTDSKKSNFTVSDNRSCFLGSGLTPGLASAC